MAILFFVRFFAQVAENKLIEVGNAIPYLKNGVVVWGQITIRDRLASIPMTIVWS